MAIYCFFTIRCALTKVFYCQPPSPSHTFQGANRHWSERLDRMERVEEDACRETMFEASSYEKELFEGTLDQVRAHPMNSYECGPPHMVLQSC